MKFKILIKVILFLFLATGSAEADETIKIGAILAKTGEAAAGNLLYLEGARYGIKKINTRGGLLGKQVELIEFDNKSTALGSKTAAKKAVNAGVIAVIGAAWSSHSLAAGPVLQENKIPMISPISTNPKVTQIGNYIFRVCFIDPFQGEVLANFAFKELNAKTAVVLINTGRTYSMELGRVFVEKFQAQGGKILWEGDYKQDETDFTGYLNKVKQLKPDIVLVPGFFRDSSFIIKQARKMKISVPFLGGDAWDKVMYDYAGESLHGNYYSTHWDHDSNLEKSRKFVEEYTAVNGKIKHSGIPLSFDAVMLLADAIKRAGSLEPAVIRDAIAATVNFEGVTGKISFNLFGDPVKSAVIMKYENKTSVYVETIEP